MTEPLHGPLTARGACRGISFVEILVAVSILAMSLIPVFEVIMTSGNAVQKSQNLSLAIGLAHKLSQHLLERPYDSIVDMPETAIADGPDDRIFNPLENYGNDAATVLRVKSGEQSSLHGLMKKFDFRYSIDVIGDIPKDVKLNIHWNERGRHLVLTMRVYVTKH